MVQLVTRQVGATAKGSALTVAELDQNFVNLNDGVVNSTASNTTINSKLTEISLDATAENVAKALHRSPNNITAMFIYDTSKDSDGGAWTTKCQNTSWYNETLSGKWLGQYDNEANARYSSLSLGNELISNGTFLTGLTGWSAQASNSISLSNNQLEITLNNAVFTGAAGPSYILTPGKLYTATATGRRGTSGSNVTVRFGSSSGEGDITFTTTSDVTKTIYFIATTTTTTPSVTTSASSGTGTIYADNISIKEVLSINTTTNDYFQLTTDGKFYKLWKNLLLSSNNLIGTNWVTNSASITTTTATTAPDGTTSAYLYTETGNNGHRIQQSYYLYAGFAYTLTAYFKNINRRYAYLGTSNYNGFGATFDLQTGIPVASASTIAKMTAVGNDWYRCQITFVATTTVASAILVGSNNGNTGANSDYVLDTNPNLYIWGPQLEVGITASEYESKSSFGSTTEIFRGNKRDFPKLAGIIAEASNVTIYDLTESNNPMWMRFLNTGNSASALSAATGGGTPNISSLSAANSILGVGSNGGVALFNFSKDDCIGARTTTTRVPKDRAIAFRNSQSGNALSTGEGFTLPSNNINQVSIKVLPTSRKDTVTNLEIPTILVAQNLGVSIIKSNGTVVNNTGSSELTSIDFNEKLFIGTSYDSSWYHLNPEFLTSFDHYSYLIQRNSFPDYYRQNWQYNNKLIKKTQVISSGAYSGLISSAFINLNNKNKSLTSIITNTYNTSWQVGDIRRTYFGNNYTTSPTNTNYMINGNFDNGTTGWSINANSTYEVVSNKLKITANINGAGSISQTTTLSISPQKVILFKFTLTALGPNSQLFVSITNGGGQGLAGYFYYTTPGTYYFTGVSNPLSNGNGFVMPSFEVRRNYSASQAGDWAEISDISLVTTELDHSYKNSYLIPNGTLIKSNVASNSELKSISGWSDSNYIQEAYSSDLDFGTGEWSVSAWFKTPVGARVNLLTYSEEFDNAAWTKTGAAVNANSTVAPNGTLTADTLTEDVSNGTHQVNFNITQANDRTFSIYAKLASGTRTLYINQGGRQTAFQLTGLGSIVIEGGVGTTGTAAISSVGNGWYRCVVSLVSSVQTNQVVVGLSQANGATMGNSYTGDGTSGIYIWGADLRLTTDSPNVYQKVVSGSETFNALLVDRSYLGGPRIALNMTGTDALQAIAYDGTTTNTVTTTTTYANNTWIKAEANYINGRLSINVNGIEVASNATTPLLSLSSRYNLLTYSEQFDNAAWTKTDATAANTSATTDPLGGTTAESLTENSATAIHRAFQEAALATANVTVTVSISLKANTRTKAVFGVGDNSDFRFYAAIDLSAGAITQSGVAVASAGASLVSASISSQGNGWHRITLTGTVATGQTRYFVNVAISNSDTPGGLPSYLGNGTSGIYIWGADLRPANIGTGAPYQRVTNVPETFIAPLTIGNSPTPKGLILSSELITNGDFNNGTTAWTAITDGSFTVSNGTATLTQITDNFSRIYQAINCVVGKLYRITGQITAVNNNASFYVHYNFSGTPATPAWSSDNILSPGTITSNFVATSTTMYIVVVLPSTDNSSVSFDNFSIREITGSYTNESFPGSLALIKLSATVPALDQSLFMYEQEKQMFRPGAQVCLPDSNMIAELAYDDTTDRWFAATSANESQWSGLVRVANTSGSYSKVVSKSNHRLTASSGNVNLTSPGLELKEQSFKNKELVNLVNNDLITLDYVGGFTANITNGSGVLASVTNQSIPSSTILNGALIEGTGIPASTTLVASNHLSAAATATTTGLQINFRDFILPIGYEAKAVLVAGSLKQEGSTKDYTRLFDGFREIIRFNTAPGNTAWVQIKAAKIA